MLKIELVGDRELVAKLQSMPEKVRASLVKAVTRLALQLERHVKLNKLSGQVLNKITGNLQSSIFHRVESDATKVTGIVAAGADVPYAAIHEFGGVIHHPGGTPYRIIKGQLRFVSKDSAFADKLPKTKAHLIKMPERSYLRSSLADMTPEIKEGLTEAVVEGMDWKK